MNIRLTALNLRLRKSTRTGRFRTRRMTPYLFILPFAAFFVLFFLVPIVYTIYESLFIEHRSGLGLAPPTISFSGLENYGRVFSDGAFYSGIGRVLLFGVVQVPICLGLALLFALLLDEPMVRLRRFFRTAFFLPYAVPSVIAAILWGFLYNPDLSPIVKVAHAIGFSGFDFLSPHTVLWSIANVVTWEWTGYNMIIMFAALQAVPTELYDSALVDGASRWAIARYIKIPLIAPALVLTCIFSIIGTLQLFNEPEVLAGISNYISGAYTPNIYIYNIAFHNNNYFYAAAMAAVLALFTFIFSFGFLGLTRRQAGV